MSIRLFAALSIAAVSLPLVAAEPSDGRAVFEQHCAACHANPPDRKTPALAALQNLQPATIVASLRDGLMRAQGQAMAPEQHIRVAEFISGRAYVPPDPVFTTGLCSAGDQPPLRNARGGDWNGWGVDLRNTRFAARGGLARADLPRLTLKWAFGVPGVTQHRAQPAVLGQWLFMASQSGAVYALDARSGCTHWSFQALSGIRTAVSVGPVARSAGGSGHAVYFTDGLANAYALDARTGGLLWRTRVDEHQAARATGAPTLHRGRLYVGISGVSESMSSAAPTVECCTFRGSVSALDANTGVVLWKQYTSPEPQRRGTSTAGKPLWGPAGASVWSAPTIDERRGLLYATTGNAYAEPPPGVAPALSVSVIAMELKTGRIAWTSQVSPGGDTWILGCGADANTEAASGPAAPAAPAASSGPNPNCPKNVGPDHDISASPVLVRTAKGRELLLVAQKASVATALDPAQRGRIVWQKRLGKGSPVGGVYGLASDGARAYYPIADQLTDSPGGLFALDPVSGAELWKAPPQPTLCAAGNGCTPAQSAAATAIPGAVFSVSADGGVRAFDAQSGAVIWLFDTNREFATVNGVKANGGSMDGPGPVVAGGMLYVTVGNGGVIGRPGNVLLAFGID